MPLSFSHDRMLFVNLEDSFELIKTTQNKSDFIDYKVKFHRPQTTSFFASTHT